MKKNQTLPQLTAELFTALDDVMTQARPDWVLVQGDTTTAFVAAMTAFYHRIPVGHVEAGLRTYDPAHPFPEEINRRLIDDVASLLFVPTQKAFDAIRLENISMSKVHLTGNTGIDALMNVAERESNWRRGSLGSIDPSKPIVLITAHRRESFGEPMERLCQAIQELAVEFAPQGFQFIYPVHLNPNVQEPVKRLLGNVAGVTLVEPLDYSALSQIMKRAKLILTDSGGIQEEAPTFGVPILVLRETTERPEGVDAGFARLVGTDPTKIVAEAKMVLTGKSGLAQSGAKNPYGDGHASIRIADILEVATNLDHPSHL